MGTPSLSGSKDGTTGTSSGNYGRTSASPARYDSPGTCSSSPAIAPSNSLSSQSESIYHENLCTCSQTISSNIAMISSPRIYHAAPSGRRSISLHNKLRLLSSRFSSHNQSYQQLTHLFNLTKITPHSPQSSLDVLSFSQSLLSYTNPISKPHLKESSLSAT